MSRWQTLLFRLVIVILITTSSSFLFISSSWGNVKQINRNYQLNEQSVLAVNWLQQSGEYVALAYQAFNVAKVVFDNALSTGVDRPAIIVDIDETILNNSPYQAGLIDRNSTFEDRSWQAWIKARKATAIPGAVDFVNYVNSQGGTIFFISNRSYSSTGNNRENDLELATIDNLRAVGFTGVNEQTVILKGEFTKTINGQEKTSKQFRREAVINGEVDGIKHTIVALIGDNLNDFTYLDRRDNQQRIDRVRQHQHRYGIFNFSDPQTKIEPAYIMLPNPMYGYWELGLYQPESKSKNLWHELTAWEKIQQRKNALVRWIFPDNIHHSSFIVHNSSFLNSSLLAKYRENQEE